jgi:hypothetical protein
VSLVKSFTDGLRPEKQKIEENLENLDLLVELVYKVAETILSYYKKQQLYDEYSLLY